RAVVTSQKSAVVIRHGETEWSLSGQHTGTTDIPLTENGRALARRLGPILAKEAFQLVLTSPPGRGRAPAQSGGDVRRRTSLTHRINECKEPGVGGLPGGRPGRGGPGPDGGGGSPGPRQGPP